MDISFKGRTLVIATMHGKESVIAPVIEEALGVKVIVANKIDTDSLGTFTGEIERAEDPLTVARLKCTLACSASECSLSIGSEGSFGPHPAVLFTHADEEILLFMDLDNKVEISVRELSLKTNFNGRLCHTWHEIKRFAESALFPSHKLIFRDEKNSIAHLTKGIGSWNDLEEQATFYLGTFGQVFVETDMRAMNNPTRMDVIRIASQKLVEKIRSKCPKCQFPGFDIINARPGLPCSWCAGPTTSTLYYVYECKLCSFSEEKMFPHGKEKEEPTYCDYCNP
jgi:hypothetical protein